MKNVIAGLTFLIPAGVASDSGGNPVSSAPALPTALFTLQMARAWRRVFLPHRKAFQHTKLLPRLSYDKTHLTHKP